MSNKIETILNKAIFNLESDSIIIYKMWTVNILNFEFANFDSHLDK